MKERLIWLDIVKGISITAVVALHTDYVFASGELFPTHAIIGGAWHVAIFFLISGFFLSYDSLLSPLTFVRRKLSSLYFPYVLYGVFAVIIHNKLLDLGLYTTRMSHVSYDVFYYSIIDVCKNLITTCLLVNKEPICGPMWFLSSLFCSLVVISLLHCVSSKILKDRRKTLLFVAGLFALFAMLSNVLSNQYDIEIPRVSKVLTASFLIYIGFCLKEVLLNKIINKYLFIASLFLAYYLVIVTGEVNLSENQYSNICYLIIVTISFFIILANLSFGVQNCVIGSILGIIGRCSLHIMSIHLFVFKIITILLTSLGIPVVCNTLTSPCASFSMWLCYTTLGVLLPVIFCVFFRKLTKLNLL